MRCGFFGWISRFYQTDTHFSIWNSGIVWVYVQLWPGVLRLCCFGPFCSVFALFLMCNKWEMVNVMMVLWIDFPIFYMVKYFPTRISLQRLRRNTHRRNTTPFLPANEPSIIIIVNNLCEIARYTRFINIIFPPHFMRASDCYCFSYNGSVALYLQIYSCYMKSRTAIATVTRFILNEVYFWHHHIQIVRLLNMWQEYTLTRMLKWVLWKCEARLNNRRNQKVLKFTVTHVFYVPN